MASRNNQNLQSLLQTIRNNFSTFLLGLTVLLVVVLAVSLFAGGGKRTNKPTKNWTQGLAEFFTGKGEPTPTPQPSVKTYTVKEGDVLWTIAETNYGSGYNAFDIASANKIENPDLVEVGQQLVIPTVESKTPTTGEAAMAATEQAMPKPSNYTVREGDTLWSIAQNYYGDGYAWVKVAEVNNLVNPDVIWAGMTLTLP